MTWANNLQPASFRGVEAEVISTDDEVSRALARHAYPYKDGVDIEDMGSNGRRISMVFIFWGDDYEDRLNAFLVALNKASYGELVHPVFGVIEKAHVASYSIRHDADNVDNCHVSVNFEESETPQPFFNSQLASQKADAIDLAATTAIEASGFILASEFNALSALAEAGNLNAISRVKALRSKVVGFLSKTNSSIGETLSSISDPIASAAGLVADLSAMTNKVIDSVTDESENLFNYATSTLNRLDSLLSHPASSWMASTSTPSYPVTTAQLESDEKILTAHVAVEAASAKAQTVGIVLAEETQEPTLTPQQVESLVNSTRASINIAIEAAHARYGIERAVAIIDPLKSLALSIQDAGAAVINSHPPIVSRTVATLTPLRLLAHLWYGDHDRAGEILRLNNLRSPNFTGAGEVLNVYSR